MESSHPRISYPASLHSLPFWFPRLPLPLILLLSSTSYFPHFPTLLTFVIWSLFYSPSFFLTSRLLHIFPLSSSFSPLLTFGSCSTYTLCYLPACLFPSASSHLSLPSYFFTFLLSSFSSSLFSSTHRLPFFFSHLSLSLRLLWFIYSPITNGSCI